jgi:hypothetical protein
VGNSASPVWILLGLCEVFLLLYVGQDPRGIGSSSRNDGFWFVSEERDSSFYDLFWCGRILSSLTCFMGERDRQTGEGRLAFEAFQCP